MGGTNEEYQYVRLTGSGVVKAGAGQLGGFLVASGTPTIQIWDNPSAASGSLILNTMQTTAGQAYPVPAQFIRGCFVTLTGAGDLTFYYR